MASDALYEALAKALSQPSRAYRTAQAAIDVPNQALEGYLKGSDIADKIKQRKLAGQTLAEALGGNVPERVRGYASLPVTTIKNLGGLGDIAKLTESPEDKGEALSPEQALQFGLPQEFIDTFKGRSIPRQVAQGYSSNQSRSRIAGALETRSRVQVANAINRNVNALTSGTGALALAGKNNLRVARVKSLLERPEALTPQELDIVTTDLAGVVQGGVPLKDTVEGQQIGTVATRFANLLKQVSNQPQVFNDSGFRKRIIALANEMIAADNQVQERAFNSVRANFGHLTTPDHLQRIYKAIKENEQLPIIEPLISGAGQGGAELDSIFNEEGVQ